MKYKTRDKEHENSARLSQILVDGGTVILRDWHRVIVGQPQAHEATDSHNRLRTGTTRLSTATVGPKAGITRLSIATVGPKAGTTRLSTVTVSHIEG